MRYALIGDSHSEVLWPLVKRALESQGHSVVISRSERGWDLLRYDQEGSLFRQLAASKPDAVVVGLGANNWEAPGPYSNRISSWVSAIRAMGAQPVWIGPGRARGPAKSDVVAQHGVTAETQKSLLRGLGVPWLDSRPITDNVPSPDGVHLDITRGYPVWAAHILKFVQENSARNPLSVTVAGIPPIVVGGLALGGASLLMLLLIRLKRRRRKL